MPININEEDGGKVIALHVSGKLEKADCEQFVPEFTRLARQNGKSRVLFDMSGFHGWKVGAAWEDFKFGVEHFSDIERLAMVGEKKWQQGMATFTATGGSGRAQGQEQAVQNEAHTNQSDGCHGQAPLTTWSAELLL